MPPFLGYPCRKCFPVLRLLSLCRPSPRPGLGPALYVMNIVVLYTCERRWSAAPCQLFSLALEYSVRIQLFLSIALSHGSHPMFVHSPRIRRIMHPNPDVKRATQVALRVQLAAILPVSPNASALSLTLIDLWSELQLNTRWGEILGIVRNDIS